MADPRNGGPVLSTTALYAGQRTISCINYAVSFVRCRSMMQDDGPGLRVITAGLLQQSPVRNR